MAPGYGSPTSLKWPDSQRPEAARPLLQVAQEQLHDRFLVHRKRLTHDIQHHTMLKRYAPGITQPHRTESQMTSVVPGTDPRSLLPSTP
jgi:hypothetical protein